MEASCLALYNSADSFHEVRKMAHERLDRWRDCLKPLIDQEKPPTLRELSGTMMQGRGQLMGGIRGSFLGTLSALPRPGGGPLPPMRSQIGAKTH